MNKYQEKKFKDFLSSIEDLVRERETAFTDRESAEYKNAEKELKKTRIKFFNWFKKLTN